jgi:hypothetical protein
LGLSSYIDFPQLQLFSKTSSRALLSQEITMKGRSLLALAVLSVALACQDDKLPTGPAAPTRVSKALSDGAHGDNADFFFLPPLVKLKKNSDFVVGTFNNTLKPRLTVEICELNTTSLPDDNTVCGSVVKTFAPGSVNLVNLPADRKDVPKPFHVDEWYKGAHRTADGFYYVLWNTQQPGLKVDKFYRIKVILKSTNSSADVLLGFADVDPRSKEGPKWKYSRTRDLIEMLDDVMLPIPFRVENIGGSCSGTDFCAKGTITNGDKDPTTFQYVRVEGGFGSIAGAKFPDNWLPPGVDQVDVTIFEIPSDPGPDGTRATPCHVGLPLQQFDKCFRFITTPVLPTDKNGDQFREFVTVAVCYSLEDSDDQRRNFAEIYASGPNETTRSLPDRSDAGILGGDARGCKVEQGEQAGLKSSNPLIRLANSGWRMLKSGLGEVFGVKTAYAVDQGLGGIVKNFSNIGPALTAHIDSYSPTRVTLEGEATSTIVRAQIIGSRNHEGSEEPGFSEGINGVPVTFTLASGNGTLRDLNSEAGGDGPVVVTTRGFDEGTEGIASVEWTPPAQAGTYHLTASGPTLNGPVTYSVTVPKAPVPPAVPVTIDGLLSPGEWDGAATFNFDAQLPNESTTPATLFVKNDGQNLYLAVRFARNVVDAGDNRLGFEFDNNNNGVGPENGDDYYGYQLSPFSVFSDAFRSGGGESVTDDTQSDGAGAFHNDGTYSVYEISHPLNSGQTGQDFALTAGSTIGLFFQLIIGGTTTTYPGTFIHYLPITITGG